MKVIVTKKKFNRWYLRIVAGNGETLTHSETYYGRSNAVRAGKNLVDSANSETWTLEVKL